MFRIKIQLVYLSKSFTIAVYYCSIFICYIFDFDRSNWFLKVSLRLYLLFLSLRLLHSYYTYLQAQFEMDNKYIQI